MDFNQGRLHTFGANGDFVEAVQFSAVLDSKTTDICESRNGKILRLDDPKLQENTPPFHYRCRTILSPITAPEWEEMQKSGELADAMDWSRVEKLPEGFGDVGKALREKVAKRHLPQISETGESRIIRDNSSEIKKSEEWRDREADRVATPLEISQNRNIMVIQYGYDENEREAIRRTLAGLPDSHLEQISEIEITNSLLLRSGDNAYATGFYSVDERKITISRYPQWIDRRQRISTTKLRGVLLHETGHHYNYTKLVKNLDLRGPIKEIHKEVLKNRDVLNNMDFPTDIEFTEFFAELYRQSRVDYAIIKRVNKQFPGLNLKSMVDEVFGG